MTLSAANGNLNLMKILIEAGADANNDNNDEFSPLHCAFLRDDTECAKMLIDAGAKVVINGEQKSAVYLAATLGSVECLKELLATHRNNQNYETKLLNVGAVDDTDSVKELIMTGKDEHVKPLLDSLISAVRNRHTESVEQLLKYGVDVNVTDDSGNTALMKSIKVSSNSVFHLLLNHGADVNAENNKGETALYLAVTQSHEEYDKMRSEDRHMIEEFLLKGSALMVYTLLREGVHLHKTKSGLNPCTVHLNSEEFNNPYPTVLKLLDAGGAKENIKELTSVNLLQDCVRDCIREHLKQVHPERNLYFTVPQLGLPKKLQSSLLFHAVQHSDLVPNSEEKELLGKIKEGDTKNIQHLINTGVDVNIQDENGMTPLMIAFQTGHIELVEQLIKSGAM